MTGCMLFIKSADGEPGDNITVLRIDSILPVTKIIRTSYSAGSEKTSIRNNRSFNVVAGFLENNKAAKSILGYSKKGLSIEAYYFPGTSPYRALVIGGVHGSELSSIEVAKKLISQLQQGESPYYSVIIIPSLFPDNAEMAHAQNEEIGGTLNIGRYSHSKAVDPNRQMPALGKAFDIVVASDRLGRPIESENQLLLGIIAAFNPQRIVNIHAIRETNHAGIFADPRTDSKGKALGYETDSSLAIDMSVFIQKNGGSASGNHHNGIPTTRYHNDPSIAAPGEWQARNTKGSGLPGGRGEGISLGSWASTEVNDPENPVYNRPAMRILTMEFPGYKRPRDYADAFQQEMCAENVRHYANAIHAIFLHNFYVEK